MWKVRSWRAYPQAKVSVAPSHSLSLIPVPVTGIQPAQVFGLKGLQRRRRSALPCDKHRDEDRLPLSIEREKAAG
ncbi:hypothetical protein CN116_27115 [Sinorhizobium meliloti]|nr:hypothetical protein CN125_31025 [Sinorhizobium meliloti]RVM40511.1 hypothetical protein CN121_31140 [Sinorhizobium meliloti]RVM57407.1 hypothetical protein CN124_30180 [Sinorhizobium meliloti]RVM61776.1 hypothetical protein CN123_29255 [Sinorhizobium meliloti]RVM78418.1 hypothetical protein CN117_28215 [Sinorhizobium meliloti]